MTDHWDYDQPGGTYDLWIRGPNGFHRHFAGDKAAARAAPTIQWRIADRKLRLEVGASSSLLRVNSEAYADHHRAWAASWQGGSMEWDLGATKGWYDLVITLDAHPSFRRRLAGRAEDGRPSITDPALGSPSRQPS